LYNDKSPLENHHCAVGFTYMMKPENNWIDSIITDKDQKRLWKDRVVDLVLSTDLSKHFQILLEFKTTLTEGKGFSSARNVDISKISDSPESTLFSKIILKCGDVSNCTKRFEFYFRWMSLIMEEFWRQGDVEKELGMTVSPFMDRQMALQASAIDGLNNSESKTGIFNGFKQISTSLPMELQLTNSYIASSQMGFVTLIVAPLFDALECFCEISEVAEGLNSTKQWWKDVQANASSKVTIVSQGPPRSIPTIEIDDN
jgi:hypothetical protein